MNEPTAKSDYIGIAHISERDGELIVTLPQELIVLGDLRVGDTAVYRKLRGGKWLIHFRRGQKKIKIPAPPEKRMYFPLASARAADAKLDKLFARFTTARTEKARARWRQEYLAVRHVIKPCAI